MPIVTFTKNMTKENRDAGLSALKIFFDNSIFKVAPYNMFTSLNGLITYLDTKYPTYIEFLGETCRSIRDDQVKSAMLFVTRNGKKSYPTPADFSRGVIDATNDSIKNSLMTTMKVVSETAYETASYVMDTAGTFMKYLPYIGLGTVALVLFLKLGGAEAGLKRIARSNPSRKRRKKK